jgi:hypothetical protein
MSRNTVNNKILTQSPYAQALCIVELEEAAEKLTKAAEPITSISGKKLSPVFADSKGVLERSLEIQSPTQIADNTAAALGAAEIPTSVKELVKGYEKAIAGLPDTRGTKPLGEHDANKGKGVGG